MSNMVEARMHESCHNACRAKFRFKCDIIYVFSMSRVNLSLRTSHVTYGRGMHARAMAHVNACRAKCRLANMI